MKGNDKMKGKTGYYMKIAATFITGAAVLAVGSAAVTVNCSNMMNGTHIVLFDVKKDDGKITFTVMDNEYTLPLTFPHG